MYFHDPKDAIGRKVEIDDPHSVFCGDAGVIVDVSGNLFIVEFADGLRAIFRDGELIIL